MTETNTIKTAMQLMLETYDGIASASIDYGNISVQRAGWTIGRQLTEQKKSDEYMTDLARQSFIGIFPTRAGKRGLTAYRDQTTASANFDEASVIEVLKYEKTPISKCYNEFNIQYDYNPGMKDFNKAIYIKNVDQTAFPNAYATTGTDAEQDFTSITAKYERIRKYTAGTYTVHGTAGWGTFRLSLDIVTPADPSAWATIGKYVSYVGTDGFSFDVAEIVNVYYDTAWHIIAVKDDNPYGIEEGDVSTSGTLYLCGASILKWTTYAGGISDYVTASEWWTICRASYLRTKRVQPLPENLSKCYWFPNNEDFDTGMGGDNSTAHKYAQLLIEWVTRQKDLVEFSIPITAGNVALELMNLITFTDTKYTGGAALSGYISMIKHVPEKCIVIEAILIPADIIESAVIVETGSASTTVTESGSQTDTITES